MMRVVVILAAFLIVVGCSEVDESNIEYSLEIKCEADTIEKRSAFILQCIESANPKSDEEPEDWLTVCQDMAEETYCPKVPACVNWFKPAYGSWRKSGIEYNCTAPPLKK